MAIRTVITRGFGNGTFNGTIALVTTRGYAIGAAAALQPHGLRRVYKLWTDPRAVKDWDDPRAIKKWTDPRAIKDND